MAPPPAPQTHPRPPDPGHPHGPGHHRLDPIPRPSNRRRALAAVLAAATMAAAAAFVPWHRGLTAEPMGDTQLAADLGPLLDSGYHRSVSAAAIDADGSVRFTGWNADEHDQFEIGSITKTFTAALLADAVERGELTPTTTLGEMFGELEGTSAGALTMEQLATQHTGLPQSADRVPLMQIWRIYLRMDGYVEDLPAMLDRVADLDTDPGTFTYSNTGVALLGHAVAQAAGTPYPQLVHERLLEPLGMEETIVPETYADLPADAPLGFSKAGVRTGPWTHSAQAPAASIRSTAHDMAIWMGAVMDGSAPGAHAVDPRLDIGEDEAIGYAWYTTTIDGTTVTWHNGGTGGFRSFAGYTPDGRAVIALGNTETWVDDAAGYLTAPADTKE